MKNIGNKPNPAPISKPAPTTSKKLSSNKNWYYGSYNPKPSFFKKNLINELFAIKEKKEKVPVIVTEKPCSGDYLEIKYDGKEFHYSHDGVNHLSKKKESGVFLTSHLVPELESIIINEFSGLGCSFFFLFGKEGVFLYDIYVNKNHVDWEDIKSIIERHKINYKKETNRKSIIVTPKFLFESTFKDLADDIKKSGLFNMSFLIREKFEDPDETNELSRSIYFI